MLSVEFFDNAQAKVRQIINKVAFELENFIVETKASNYDADSVAADILGAERGLDETLRYENLLPQIKRFASSLPKSGRDGFLRTIRLAAEVAMHGNTLDITILNREDRYQETRVSYEKAPTVENAASLKAAMQNLRTKQIELGLSPEPMDQLASQAFSQVRPSRAKAELSSPSGPARGRPRIAKTAPRPDSHF